MVFAAELVYNVENTNHSVCTAMSLSAIGYMANHTLLFVARHLITNASPS